MTIHYISCTTIYFLLCGNNYMSHVYFSILKSEYVALGKLHSRQYKEWAFSFAWNSFSVFLKWNRRNIVQLPVIVLVAEQRVVQLAMCGKQCALGFNHNNQTTNMHVIYVCSRQLMAAKCEVV